MSYILVSSISSNNETSENILPDNNILSYSTCLIGIYLF